MARWKLLSGVHFDSEALPVHLENIEGAERAPGTFYAGDIFDSDRNLLRHNVQGSVRFEKLSEESDNLDTLTVSQLRALAEEEEIELPSNMKKAAMVAAIRGQLNYREAVAAG